MKERRIARSAVIYRSRGEGGFVNLGISIALLVWVFAGSSVLSAMLFGFFSPQEFSKVSERTLSVAERVSYQRAIEEVYWRHRIWPKERPGSKPLLDAVISQGQLEQKVGDYLRESQLLEDRWHRPITSEQLQAEMDRMATNTKQPEVLHELFEALGNDPFYAGAEQYEPRCRRHYQVPVSTKAPA